MKRYVITISCLLCVALLAFGLYYAGGFYIELPANTEPSFAVRTQEDRIEYRTETGWEDFEIRGVNLGSGIPGEWSTDYAIDQQTYLRWFSQMQQMGVNVVRVYSVQAPEFYRALEEFNKQAQTPIYLLQGIWVDEYAQNSHVDAFDRVFQEKLIESCKTAVDVVHGKRFILSNDADSGAGFFFCDVSQWLLGYVIGGEWMDVTVAYTDEKYPQMEAYVGNYLYTTEDATAFEIMLAQTGDMLIAYETERYEQQRLVSFANTKTTDPFDYPQEVKEFFRKCASIDMEHIQSMDAFETGLFASYSVYSYDLDYFAVMEPEQWQSLTQNTVNFDDCNGTNGTMDTYLAYWKLLNAHHRMPVVALEFGVATGRGMAQQNTQTGLHEGYLSEQEQGAALVECWEDIVKSGCAGACVYSWQDEWNKRTWNTMFAVDISRSPYWSDAQSSDQHFGLLAFEPGEERVCIVDGDDSEWDASDVVVRSDDGACVSVKYDARYLYFCIRKPGFVFGEDTLYLPIDTTQKTGTTVCPDYDLSFDRAVDFLVQIHTEEDSVLMVQDRYHAIHANFEAEITGEDAYIAPPAKDSSHFEVAQMAIKDSVRQFWEQPATLDTFETGRLHYGNADPEAENYDSLTDFAMNGDTIELRLPWALLNFADPSRMQIHDDYYDGNYGVEFITLKKLFVGLGTSGQNIKLEGTSLKGWGNRVTWQERLKPAYDALKTCWTGGEDA